MSNKRPSVDAQSVMAADGSRAGCCCAQAMREVLASCPYGDNDVYLHMDAALMPVRRATWASWNFLGTSAPDGDDAAVCVSYWVNHLQVCPWEPAAAAV